MTQMLNEFLFPEDVTKTFWVKDSTPIFSLVAFYVVFSKWLGPAIMSSRKPYDLTRAIVIYNFSQVAINAWLTFNLIKFEFEVWDFRCDGITSPEYPNLLKNFSKYHYLIYLDRVLDCLDTIFFVLRKKYNQISFLHVFHHAFMCCFIRYTFHGFRPGFYLLVSISINTGVHTIMYFYYALAACGPHMQKYLWWKKYMTVVQMVQFAAIMVYMTVDYFTGCEEMGVYDLAIFIFVTLMLRLFYNFYTKSFKKE